MRDAFGGEFMIRLFLVFIFIYIMFSAVSLNYAKAFRLKNSVIDYLEKNEILEEIQDREMQMKEFMLLGLRKIEGIRNQDFYNKFGIDVEEEFEIELKKLRKENLIEKDKVKLTNRGLDLANIVWEEFI